MLYKGKSKVTIRPLHNYSINFLTMTPVFSICVVEAALNKYLVHSNEFLQ